MKRCVLFDVDKGTEMRQRCGETILDVPHCDDVRLFGNSKRTDIKFTEFSKIENGTAPMWPEVE